MYLMAAGTVFFWGASFPLTKLALQWTGPISIAFLRWVISTAMLIGWIAARRKLPTAVGLMQRRGAKALWVALTGITLFYFLENLALRYTTAINAGVLSNLTTVFLVMLGTLWLGERLTRTEAGAIAVALVGATLVSQGAGHLSLTATGLKGDLMMVFATFFAALYSIGGKWLVAEYPADTVITVVAGLGTILLLPLALWEGLDLSLPVAAWASLLLLGLGSGVLANLWWMQILGHTNASRAGMILLLIPVVSTVIAVLLLGEALQPAVLLGSLLVLAGVAIVESQEAEPQSASGSPE
jgi:drug/metabolite transporter (DMT)-like permease